MELRILFFLKSQESLDATKREFQKFPRPSDYLFRPLQKSLNELKIYFKSICKTHSGALAKDGGNFSDIEFMQIEQDAAAATEIRRFHFQNYSRFPFSGRGHELSILRLSSLLLLPQCASRHRWVEEDECRSERTNGARFMHAISHSFLSFFATFSRN